MILDTDKTWSRGLNAANEVHLPTDAACRLTAEDFADIHHEPKFKLKKDSTIFTFGSCFARNIEDIFEMKGYDVQTTKLQLPRELYKGQKPSSVLTKFNTQSMLTELQISFGERGLDEDGLIEIKEGRFWNPQLHRVGLVERDQALFVKEKVHENVRMIEVANLVIVTLGLTEYWYDKVLGVPLNDTPIDWRFAVKSNRFEHRNADFRTNLEIVRELCSNILDKTNGDGRIILTVSPVPLQRTFSNQDVIVANSYSKSVLRAVAQEVANANEKVDYYPSFEMVTYSNRSRAWRHDQRHVQFELIQKIIQRFEDIYFE